jgi:hypothetical protein
LLDLEEKYESAMTQAKKAQVELATAGKALRRREKQDEVTRNYRSTIPQWKTSDVDNDFSDGPDPYPETTDVGGFYKIYIKFVTGVAWSRQVTARTTIREVQ